MPLVIPGGISFFTGAGTTNLAFLGVGFCSSGTDFGSYASSLSSSSSSKRVGMRIGFFRLMVLPVAFTSKKSLFLSDSITCVFGLKRRIFLNPRI
jgi:hypothetical protein